MDYEKLLRAFMRLVETEEGCLFLSRLENKREQFGLTKEEFAELEKIGRETEELVVRDADFIGPRDQMIARFAKSWARSLA